MSDEFAAIAQFIKQRWPHIGRHLDHPLAKFLYLKKEQPRWMRRGKNLDHYPYYYQPSSFLLGRKRTELHDLWLTGIRSRELAAIEAMLGMQVPRKDLGWWLGFCFWEISGLGFIGLLSWAAFPAIFLKISSILVMGLPWSHLYLSITNEGFFMKRAILRFYSMIEYRARNKTEAAKGCLRIILILFVVMLASAAIVALVAVAIIVICDIFRPETAIQVLTGCVALIIIGVALKMARYTSRALDYAIMKSFRKCCTQGDDLVRKTIYRENEI